MTDDPSPTLPATSARLRLRPNALQWREIEGEIVALDGETSQYVAANASAALLWHKLAEGTTRDELVEALVEAFGIERERAATDIDAFLADLGAQRLLET
jgi:hypothetical protein